MALPPHGNVLVNRVLRAPDAEHWRSRAASLRHITIDEELVKDVKNIARGVYSPLMGFMNSEDIKRVVMEMKLANGVVWPIPFFLAVDPELASAISVGEQVMLVSSEDNPIALLTVQDIFPLNKHEIAEHVFGTTNQAHPGVEHLIALPSVAIGGDIELIDITKEPFNHFNLDPLETRLLFREKRWKTVAGFQTRNAPHRAHEYLQRIGLELCDGLFINPVIGKKKKGDFTDEAILVAYAYMVQHVFPRDRAVLSILPLQMRYAGPREAVLHALIRKNFGCTHFIVGRDHAGVGNYYDTYAAQEIFDMIDDIGMTILKLENSFHCQRCETVATSKTCAHAADDRIAPSGTQIRNLLQEGKPVPETIMRPEISEVLLNSVKTIFVE